MKVLKGWQRRVSGRIEAGGGLRGAVRECTVHTPKPVTRTVTSLCSMPLSSPSAGRGGPASPMNLSVAFASLIAVEWIYDCGRWGGKTSEGSVRRGGGVADEAWWEMVGRTSRVTAQTETERERELQRGDE